MTNLSFELKRPSRIESQLHAFHGNVLKGFRAGTWFEMRVLSGPRQSPMFQNFNVSIRSLARQQLVKSRRGGEPEAEGNPIRDIWSRRKPIAHMAIAAANAIAREHERQGIDGFDLEMTLFNPVWVADAIDAAEGRARGAVKSGAFGADQMCRFHRDTF